MERCDRIFDSSFFDSGEYFFHISLSIDCNGFFYCYGFLEENFHGLSGEKLLWLVKEEIILLTGLYLLK